MSKDELKKIDKKNLPWFFRLVLKIPGADFLEGTSSGIFWSVVMPIFLASEFFLSLFLLIFFPFPTNLIVTSLIPAIVLLIFVRINLERFINWWNANLGEPREWNVEKTIQEYLTFLEKKNKKNKKS